MSSSFEEESLAFTQLTIPRELLRLTTQLFLIFNSYFRSSADCAACTKTLLSTELQAYCLQSQKSYSTILRSPNMSENASNINNPPPTYEAACKEPLDNLQHQIVAYQELEERGGGASIEDQAQNVAAAMHKVGDTQTDPKVKGDWHRRAEKFARATKPARERIIKGVGGTVFGLLSLPFMLAGTALQVAGGVVHTAGSAIGGVGDFVLGSSKDGLQGGSQGSQGGPKENVQGDVKRKLPLHVKSSGLRYRR
ncbi:hypothetical protein Hypma_012156 [Hypsizygus marmoreus]|uniref:Uncharacterized protein n=1 Tax=Hypsizygus marmoreus TaxID=39966 RepID=A0A369JF89_HYPMA|nr:hypothetical protein Hypma_012156 [Hypsizygus marmoreus]